MSVDTLALLGFFLSHTGFISSVHTAFIGQTKAHSPHIESSEEVKPGAHEKQQSLGNG